MFGGRNVLVLGAILTVFSPGCRAGKDDAAQVGGIGVPIESVQSYLEMVTGSPWTEVDSRVASKLLDQLLGEEAVVVVFGDGEDADRDDPVARTARVRSLILEACGPAPTPAPEDVERVIEERGLRTTPDQCMIRQLLLPSLKEARTIRERLESGEDWLELSRETSHAPNADRGGPIGWVARGTQPDTFESEIFSLDLGEISQPVEGPAGYHLFQVLEVRPSGTVTRETAEADARRELEGAASRKHLELCIDRAVAEAEVRVFKENLWFDYRGRFAED